MTSPTQACISSFATWRRKKAVLLSKRRFRKSSLTMAMLKLRKRHIRTVSLAVSSYSSYTQFLEKYAEKVLCAAGPLGARQRLGYPLRSPGQA